MNRLCEEQWYINLIMDRGSNTMDMNQGSGILTDEELQKYINDLDSFFVNDKPMGDETDQRMSEKKFAMLNKFIEDNTEK